jgi:hypothetical protein
MEKQFYYNLEMNEKHLWDFEVIIYEKILEEGREGEKTRKKYG